MGKVEDKTVVIQIDRIPVISTIRLPSLYRLSL